MASGVAAPGRQGSLNTKPDMKKEMEMASVTQLGYLGIGVSDIAKWEAFAAHVLGLQIGERSNDGTLFLRMDDYHHRLALHPNGSDDVEYVGWEVVDEHALREIADQLRSAGTEVTVGTAAEAEARRVVGLIRFNDPSGVSSEVYFGPMQSFDAPFVSPRGVSGFVTDNMGFGHIVIAVNDLEESIAFYRDVLGLRISDFIHLERPPGNRMKMAFFHCNPRHHSLAFMAMKPTKRLNHFMLQAQSINDVGTTFDLCQDQGVRIMRGMGRHTNDHMMSFYMESPSGFQIEYGWGGREVDDATWQVQQHTSGSMWGHRPMPEPVGSGA